MFLTDTTLWIFYITGRTYKMNNIFNVCIEKKTTKPAEQHYRLGIYTEQNRKLVYLFEHIFDDFLSQKSETEIKETK